MAEMDATSLHLRSLGLKHYALKASPPLPEPWHDHGPVAPGAPVLHFARSETKEPLCVSEDFEPAFTSGSVLGPGRRRSLNLSAAR